LGHFSTSVFGQISVISRLFSLQNWPNLGDLIKLLKLPKVSTYLTTFRANIRHTFWSHWSRGHIRT